MQIHSLDSEFAAILLHSPTKIMTLLWEKRKYKSPLPTGNTSGKWWISIALLDCGRIFSLHFCTNLRMSMPRRWRWISGVIPVVYPPPGIWQGRNGKWLGQKSEASKTSLPTLQFVGSMCLFSWVCRNKLLGTYLNLHATHMIHYQARCALTRQKVKIDRDGKEVTLRPKHLVLATGLPLGCGKASAVEVLKDWGHQGPKLCFSGLVFVAS